MYVVKSYWDNTVEAITNDKEVAYALCAEGSEVWHDGTVIFCNVVLPF